MRRSASVPRTPLSTPPPPRLSQFDTRLSPLVPGKKRSEPILPMPRQSLRILYILLESFLDLEMWKLSEELSATLGFTADIVSDAFVSHDKKTEPHAGPFRPVQAALTADGRYSTLRQTLDPFPGLQNMVQNTVRTSGRRQSGVHFLSVHRCPDYVRLGCYVGQMIYNGPRFHRPAVLAFASPTIPQCGVQGYFPTARCWSQNPHAEAYQPLQPHRQIPLTNLALGGLNLALVNSAKAAHVSSAMTNMRD
ncbi:hypothetical protein C8T65DRAFT_727720 [Cerioporus squamosus]|nr:hypothetical protein C8T65DRAFT_727720 [Cerioporus squamosus]